MAPVLGLVDLVVEIDRNSRWRRTTLASSLGFPTTKTTRRQRTVDGQEKSITFRRAAPSWRRKSVDGRTRRNGRTNPTTTNKTSSRKTKSILMANPKA